MSCVMTKPVCTIFKQQRSRLGYASSQISIFVVGYIRDSKLRGTRLFSSSILIFFQYACHTVRPDFRRLPIGIYIDKRVHSAIIVVMF